MEKGLEKYNIYLNDILNIPQNDFIKYKIKFMKSNKFNVEPLNVMIESENELRRWIGWKYKVDDLSREYVISFVRYYILGVEKWLFSGIYKVVKKNNFNKLNDDVAYDLIPIEEYFKYFGRLVVEYKNKNQNLIRKAENIINDIKVIKILDRKYSGIEFCGYNNINLSFKDLEIIINNKVEQWKNKLENITGIYMLVDKHTGKKYIGSAYGTEGIWNRWNQYINDKNGGNKELSKLSDEYIKENLNFVLLEWYAIGTDSNLIIERENFWKEATLSRIKDYGYNDN